MVADDKKKNGACNCLEGRFVVPFTEPMLRDRLHTLSAEYSVSEELLVSVAVKRLLDDVDFIRNLRIGKIESE